jgi:hypothetical protein
LLHRLEEEGAIHGRWGRRLNDVSGDATALPRWAGKYMQKSWKDLVALVSRITGIEYA